MRDEFPKHTKHTLAARVGSKCSNPSCRALTSGPQLDEKKSVNIGVAAHITAASPNGPRYDKDLSEEERSEIKNGIWLCQNCAKLIDNDEIRFSVQLLHQWKLDAENYALSKIIPSTSGTSKKIKSDVEQQVKRRLELRDNLQHALLKPLSDRGQSTKSHPYSKFLVSNIIVRSIHDTKYPEVDTSSGISSWFRVEPFDFYHSGIDLIITMQRAIINREDEWKIIDYDDKYDQGRFWDRNIWVIGQLPYGNILAYDLKGDEFYNEPHLYCLFAYNGTPYEKIKYAVVGGADDYDWSLDVSKRIK